MQTEVRYLDVAGVALYLSKTKRAVHHLVAQAQIPHIRMGRSLRFDRAAIDQWMKGQMDRRKPQ